MINKLITQTKETQGEDLIADFLEEHMIKFERYYILPNLKEDNHFFREADFFLPEYNVCIEFLGQWDNPEHKQRYKQKMAVYHKNNIPCIYLWPDNLGTLGWMIKRRLRETLLKYGKYYYLFKFELGEFWAEFGILIIALIVIIYIIKDIKWRIAFSIYLIYSLYTWINKYITRITKLKKSPWSSYNYGTKKETKEGNEN